MSLKKGNPLPPFRLNHSHLVHVGFIALLVMLWCYLRGYQGFNGDAQIYAFQALARIHPELSTDLFLQNSSQDRFTIFTPLYALAIKGLGLRAATVTLFVTFTGWFYAAAWSLARRCCNIQMACLAVGSLIIAGCDYGGSGVFHHSECYLSARLPAEALITTALACQGGRCQATAWPVALAALLVHPLIALPGLLTLLVLKTSLATAISAAVLLTLCVALLSIVLPGEPRIANVFPTMDSNWLMIVRERSQFLLPQLWPFRDWNINVRPMLFLLFASTVVLHQGTKKLCIASIVVAITGVTLALLSAVSAPIALLIQGQAWRWVWISSLLSILLLPISIGAAWRNGKCGALCVVLLIDSWIIPGDYGCALICCALILWRLRNRIHEQTALYLKWFAFFLGTASIAWTILSGWSAGASLIASNKRMLVTNLQALPAVKLCATAAFVVLTLSITRAKPLAAYALIGLMMLASGLRLPYLAHGRAVVDERLNSTDFAGWTEVIPPTTTVLVTPSRDVGTFVWFTLLRPNYLSLDQSAGVVFSRATALEVQRRSEVLRPLQPPSWQIFSGVRNAAASPLDAAILRQICKDRLLGFVISNQEIDIPRKTHTQVGEWMNWNLYDCSSMRT